jgi:hypothetical protein
MRLLSKKVGLPATAIFAAASMVVLANGASALDAPSLDKILIPFQLQPDTEIISKITEAVGIAAQSYEGKLPQSTLLGLSSFAKLIVASSSVEKSPHKQYVVLYSTFADLFTIIQYNSNGSIQAVFLINGDAATRLFGQGKIAEEKDVAVRMFNQRPSLQRAIGRILEDFPEASLPELKQYQTDKIAARSVVFGLLVQARTIEDYKKAPCREAAETYRSSESFALRYRSGKADTAHMIPAGLVKLGELDAFAFQDDSMARSYAFIEVGDPPSCSVKSVRTFFSY